MATFKLDRYIAEAQIDSYVLEVDDDRGNDITIVCPTGETLVVIGEIPLNEGRKFLRLLCGDQFEVVWQRLAPLPGPVLMAVLLDMIEHFGIGQMAAVPGGSRALPR